MKNWYVYILKCRDNTLYTGVSIDLEKRVDTHNKGTGAKYTRHRLPVRLLWSEKLKDESAALKREAEIKALSRTQKLALIKKV